MNRLSIGIESFDYEKLSFLGRRHSYESALRAIELIKSYEFDNINLDLIYGVPEETLATLKKDLNLILKLNPNHISTYSLIFEDNTRIVIDKQNPINEELDAKMYDLICKTLKKKGYTHYEVSNFCKPGFESKHNLITWHNEEYYGFGLGASGYLHGVRYENTRSLNKYLCLEFIRHENIVSKQEMMENELMLGLRLMEGISFKKFYSKYKVNLQEVFPIAKLVESKDLIYKDGYISISIDKIYLMNEILMKLF